MLRFAARPSGLASGLIFAVRPAGLGEVSRVNGAPWARPAQRTAWPWCWRARQRGTAGTVGGRSPGSRARRPARPHHFRGTDALGGRSHRHRAWPVRHL